MAAMASRSVTVRTPASLRCSTGNVRRPGEGVSSASQTDRASGATLSRRPLASERAVSSNAAGSTAQIPAAGASDSAASAIPALSPPPPQQDGPDLNQPAGESDAVERFDQQGAIPWADAEPALGLRGQSALGGEQALGPGMALMEQRLEQIEGDPSLLMRNQFQIEELRQLRESGGRVQEARPW